MALKNLALFHFIRNQTTIITGSADILCADRERKMEHVF
jgi:hypothetical protein